VKRGKLLVSYNLKEEIGVEKFNQIKSVLRKTANKWQKEYLDKVTYDTFNARDFNLRFYKTPVIGKRTLEYDFLFLRKVHEITAQKSEKDRWEIDSEPNIKIDRGEIESKVLERASGWRFYSNIDVYEYGKNGLEIIFKNDDNTMQKDVKALPACQDYYYHDWKRDGICVQSENIFLKRSYKVIEPDETVLQEDAMEPGEGVPVSDIWYAARFIVDAGALNFDKCPPGTKYETKYQQISEYDDETEKTTIHVNNVTSKQEIDIFKKIFPNWKKVCPDI
jgi:hypothetical protein